MSEENLETQENEIINIKETVNEFQDNQSNDLLENEIISNKHPKHSKCLIVFGVISLLSFIGVIILLVMMFCCGDRCSTSSNGGSSAVKTIQKGDLKIAYINTDSVLIKYEYAKDLEKNIKTYQQQLESGYEAQGRKLEADIQNFLKTGEKLTLTEQKNKEAELKKRQQEFAMGQQKIMMQLQERQVDENKKLLNAVYAFIKDFNSKNQKFNIILSKSFASSPVLYADDGLDITEEIVKGLNEEYKNIKK